MCAHVSGIMARGRGRGVGGEGEGGGVATKREVHINQKRRLPNGHEFDDSRNRKRGRGGIVELGIRGRSGGRGRSRAKGSSRISVCMKE